METEERDRSRPLASVDDPIKCVEKITLNDPGGLAEPLLDLLICATAPGFKDSNEYDEILDMLYVKLDHCRDSRDKYITDRAASAPA